MMLLLISPMPPARSLIDELKVADCSLQHLGKLDLSRCTAADGLILWTTRQSPLGGADTLRDEGIETPIVLVNGPQLNATNVQRERLSYGLKYVVDAPIKVKTLLLELHRARYPKANAPGLDPQTLIAERMALMRAVYSDTLLERIQAIEEDTRSFNPSDREPLYTKVHNLKGTAGTYSFTRVSQIAAQLERALSSKEPSLLSLKAFKQTVKALYLAREEEL